MTDIINDNLLTEEEQLVANKLIGKIYCDHEPLPDGKKYKCCYYEYDPVRYAASLPLNEKRMNLLLNAKIEQRELELLQLKKKNLFEEVPFTNSKFNEYCDKYKQKINKLAELKKLNSTEQQVENNSTEEEQLNLHLNLETNLETRIKQQEDLQLNLEIRIKQREQEDLQLKKKLSEEVPNTNISFAEHCNIYTQKIHHLPVLTRLDAYNKMEINTLCNIKETLLDDNFMTNNDKLDDVILDNNYINNYDQHNKNKITQTDYTNLINQRNIEEKEYINKNTTQ